MTSSVSAALGRVHRAYAPGPHGQIHYRRSGPIGARSPLVLLHPFPGSSYLFEGLMSEMGHDRSLIAPDMPGFGMSDPPGVTPTISTYATAMLDLVAELGLGMVDVMGYHAGGSVAVEMARQQPDVVRKLILISAFIFTPDETAAAKKHSGPKFPDEVAPNMGGGWSFFSTQFWRMGTDPARTWNIYLDAQKDNAAAQDGRMAALEYRLPESLAEVNQPILVLMPDDDAKDNTMRVPPLLKNGRVQDLPGWTHGFLDAKAAEVAELLRGFLDRGAL
jgi:pimeloyl-ACP methyl ester carboxylesterase